MALVKNFILMARSDTNRAKKFRYEVVRGLKSDLSFQAQPKFSLYIDVNPEFTTLYASTQAQLCASLEAHKTISQSYLPLQRHSEILLGTLYAFPEALKYFP